METSALALRAAGLDEKAEELRRAAEALEKLGVGPPPGKRLDLMQSYVERCKGRRDKASKLVEATQTALNEARKKQTGATRELEEAEASLEKLRADLAATAAAPMKTDGDAQEELAELRGKFEQPRRGPRGSVTRLWQPRPRWRPTRTRSRRC